MSSNKTQPKETTEKKPDTLTINFDGKGYVINFSEKSFKIHDGGSGLGETLLSVSFN